VTARVRVEYDTTVLMTPLELLPVRCYLRTDPSLLLHIPVNPVILLSQFEAILLLLRWRGNEPCH
jgi:hypothetical protein